MIRLLPLCWQLHDHVEPSLGRRGKGVAALVFLVALVIWPDDLLAVHQARMQPVVDSIVDGLRQVVTGQAS